MVVLIAEVQLTGHAINGGVNNRGVSNGSINNRGVGNGGVSNGGVNNRGVINRTCDFASGSFFGHRFFCYHGLDTLGVIRKCSKRF